MQSVWMQNYAKGLNVWTFAFLTLTSVCTILLVANLIYGKGKSWQEQQVEEASGVDKGNDSSIGTFLD